MAITVETNIPENVWSSMIPETISIATDEPSLKIELMVSNTKIYTTTLSAYEGKVTLHSVADIIENRFASEGKIMLYCDICFLNLTSSERVAISFKAFYSYRRVNIPVLDFANKNFTTLSPYTKTSDCLHIFTALVIAPALGNITFTAKVLYMQPDGDIGIYNKSLNWGHYGPAIVSQINYALLGVPISKKILSDYLTAASLPYTDILACNLFCSTGATHMIYFTQEREELVLTFRNNFNFWETVSLPGVTTTKTKKEASLGNLGREVVQYDCTTKTEYEFISPILPTEYALYLSELLSSRDIRIGSSSSPETLQRIILTDNTSEISTDDTKEVSIKFTYRYTHNRGMLEIPSSSDVFSEPFSQEFN